MSLIRRQKAEGRAQTTRSGLPTAYRLLPTARGFTLVEMLVVMGIIILAITMAIPTIRYLTGAKSEQSAENAVAAMLAAARADAIGSQQPEGVLFLIDEANDRVVMREVMQTIQPGDPAGVTYLDLVPDRDSVPLPTGIRALTIKDNINPPPALVTTSGTTINTVDPFYGYRYLGFNNNTNPSIGTYTGSVPTDISLIGGVILFDGYGNLSTAQYGFRFSIGGVMTALGNAIVTPATGGTNAPPSGMPVLWPASGANPQPYLRAQLGLVLVDKETFQNQERLLSPPPSTFDGNPETTMSSGTTDPREPVLDTWLDTNTTPILIDRYNGTLIRAE